MSRLRGYLRLARPANVVTSLSDVLAGAAIAGSLISVVIPGLPYGSTLGAAFVHHEAPAWPLILLLFSTACLYAGGVVLNDFFDARLDATERPERPIPSGLIKARDAAILGSVLLFAGIGFALLSDINRHLAFSEPFRAYSIGIAAAIAVASVVYDKWGKHKKVPGPINMGLCRALNLLLGMSVLSYYPMYVYWPLIVVPMIYIGAITMISRGEVHGGKKITLYGAVILYVLVISAIAFMAYLNQTMLWSFPFLILFAVLIFPPLVRAIQQPVGPKIGKAVKSGVISLIVMNASWAAAFGDPYLAVFILLLLPLSLLLARLFAVT